ncbi:MAG TPA: hypothetical protein VHA33_00575 [Candidatus Angelobacter sp.]|jgi:hypothetical protein|nr:hypothetical protein [Candidatus Angelobacter sp.]
MADSKPSGVQEATLEELLVAIKANIPVAGGSGPCPAEPSFAGDWEVADRDSAERVKKAAAEVRAQLLSEHRSPKEALVQELLAAVTANKPFATGTGRCPAVPCFDHHDRDAEANRPGWEVVEGECAERVRRAAAALRKFLEVG